MILGMLNPYQRQKWIIGLSGAKRKKMRKRERRQIFPAAQTYFVCSYGLYILPSSNVHPFFFLI